MDITPLIPAGRQVIRSYGNGGFTIADVRHDGSVLVTAEQTFPLDVASLEDLSLVHFDPLWEIEPKIDLLLIGTGAKMAFLPDALRGGLKAHGISVDSMDSGAAARTYNVLLSEERLVAAAIIAVK